MLLGKSCKKAFNIKNIKKIKVGTLFEYRKIENLEIADLHEGRLTFTLKVDGIVPIKPKWINTIFDGAIELEHDEKEATFQTLGTYNIEVVTLTILKAEKQYFIKDSEVNIKREAHNSFIFCMSHVRKTTDCIGIFKGYDDYWYLSDKRAHLFGLTLGKVLLNTITKEHKKGNYIISKDAIPDELDIMLTFGRITYQDRETHISKDSVITIEEYASKIDNMAFTKPSIPFEPEKEFRFQYTIYGKDGLIYQPLVDNIILDAEELLQFVF
jgi:hypothetical protein